MGDKAIVRIYLRGGVVFEYYVDDEDQAMRHAQAIANDGYQRKAGEWVEFFGRESVMKTKAYAPGYEQEYVDRRVLV